MFVIAIWVFTFMFFRPQRLKWYAHTLLLGKAGCGPFLI
jgi:preprotein translocase subunit YajC